jgi:hypothetical protein
MLFLRRIRDMVIRDQAGTVARGAPEGETFRKIHRV